MALMIASKSAQSVFCGYSGLQACGRFWIALFETGCAEALRLIAAEQAHLEVTRSDMRYRSREAYSNLLRHSSKMIPFALSRRNCSRKEMSPGLLVELIVQVQT